jgi:dihydrolipoamide dehydrogenase
MPNEFKLPNLGEGVDSGEVVSVTAKAGDKVEKGSSLCEVETNKAVMDVTANFSGSILSVQVKPGDKVKPGQVIVAYEPAQAGTAPAAPVREAKPAPAASPAVMPAPQPAKAAPPAPAESGSPATEAHHGLSPEEASKLHVVVIGAGPGGYAAAFYASDLGYQVTLVNKETRLGGVCTLRGCIPSKGLLHVAKLLNEAKHAGAWGLDFGAPKIDVDKLRAWKDGFVNQLGAGIGQVAAARKVRTIEGLARFKDSSTLEILPGDGGTQPALPELKFDYCIIATGSVPAMPGPWNIGDARVMDSTGALELKDIPKRLCVIGGGYIGLEMACVYAALGSEITVVEFLPGLLMAADRDLVRPLQQRLSSSFKAIHVNTKVEKLEATQEGIRVSMTGEGVQSPQVFDRVLVSVGRRPLSQGLGLEKTKVKVTDKGFIEHDSQLRTTDPKIFVIGDVAGEPMLAHKAHAEAKVAVEAINGQRSAYDVIAMPAVVFTDPELAWVGITEEEAKKQSLQVEVARYPWAASGKAHAIDRTEGVSKVIVDRATGRILGAGVTGFEAGNLISEYALAIEMGANAEDLSMTVHPHPTLGETLLGAVDITLGHATDIYRPKRSKPGAA